MHTPEVTKSAPSEIAAPHILVLDDEPAIRTALARLLKSLKYRCTVVADGEYILELIDNAHRSNLTYDLAILDIKIPDGMGGIETMRRIQQLGIGLPMISMSGYSTTEIFVKDEDRSGFSGHLQKPFNAKQLSAELTRLCPSR